MSSFLKKIEGLRLRIRKYKIKKYSKNSRSLIANDDFTIISNNCWGGQVYESFSLRKNSPTIGLFIFPDDYIRLLKRMKEYFSSELKFINPNSSKWINQEELNNKKYGKYPVGKITLEDGENIEIFFLHYDTENQAKEKWNRRCERINYDRMLVKFNDQNGATEDNIEEFVNLKIKNKILFTARKFKKQNLFKQNLDNYFYINQIANKNYVTASHEPILKNRYVDLPKILNNL